MTILGEVGVDSRRLAMEEVLHIRGKSEIEMPALGRTYVHGDLGQMIENLERCDTQIDTIITSRVHMEMYSTLL